MRYELILWLMWFLKQVPGRIGCALRRRLLPSRIGPKVMIWDNVQIDSPKKLVIGARSSVNRGSILNCAGGIEIGTDVLIGPNVILYSQNHAYADSEHLISEQGYICEKLTIENDVWIASNAIILPGVTVACGCVIGAGSVVTKSTKPYGVYAGTPARRIADREGGLPSDPTPHHSLGD